MSEGTVFAGIGNAGAVPLGGQIALPSHFPVKVEMDGVVFLRSGYFEDTDYSPALKPFIKANLIPVPIAGNAGLSGTSSGYTACDGAGNFMVVVSTDALSFTSVFSSDFFETYQKTEFTHASAANQDIKLLSLGPNSGKWLLFKLNKCFYSHNNGQTWTQCANTTIIVRCFALSPVTGTILIFDPASRQVERSTDGGVSWSKYVIPAIQTHNSSLPFLSLSDGSFVFIATAESDGLSFVFHSENDGLSFTKGSRAQGTWSSAGIAEMDDGNLVLTGAVQSQILIADKFFTKSRTIAGIGGISNSLQPGGLAGPPKKIDGNTFIVGATITTDKFKSITPLPYLPNGSSFDTSGVGIGFTNQQYINSSYNSAEDFSLCRIIPAAGSPFIPASASGYGTQLDYYGVNYVRIK